MPHPTRVLIAAPALVIRQLRAALPEHVEVSSAAIWDDALQRLSEVAQHLIVICYVFDEMRPYRLIQHVRALESQRTPILLIRAVTVPWGATQESDLRRGYEEMGVDAFLNFSDLANTQGLETALQEFRRIVVSLLPK